MKTKMYLHSSKESNYELGEQLGLKGETLSMFRHALSEVEFEVDVDENGFVTILTVDGHEVIAKKKEVEQ